MVAILIILIVIQRIQISIQTKIIQIATIGNQVILKERTNLQKHRMGNSNHIRRIMISHS